MKRKIPNYNGITKLGLIPLRNFAMVDEKKNIYRSAQPLFSYDYDFIKKKLGIDILINLRSELKHDDMMNSQKEFRVINVDVPDHCVPTIQQAKDFMSIIKNNDNILFHCEHGRGRTSTFCVLAKLALGWTLKDALEEEVLVYGYDFHHPKQLEFLKSNFK